VWAIPSVIIIVLQLMKFSCTVMGQTVTCNWYSHLCTSDHWSIIETAKHSNCKPTSLTKMIHRSSIITTFRVLRWAQVFQEYLWNTFTHTTNSISLSQKSMGGL